MCLMTHETRTASTSLLTSGVWDPRKKQDHLSFLLVLYSRVIFSKVSTITKRFLSSSDTTALPGLSTTKDFMPAAIAASTSLTLSLRNKIVSGAS
jgi:hypothetical protein